MIIKLLEYSGNSFPVVFTMEPEHTPIGEFVECPRTLRSLKDKIRRNILFHFCAKATVYDKDGNEVGTSYLGDCYYPSLRDFVDNSGYARQMMEEAIKESEAPTPIKT